LLAFDLPSVRRKKLTSDFEGGNQSSDAGLLLREAERKLGMCRRLAEAMPDHRDPDRIRHAMFEMVMGRAATIACGYEDGIDFDRLRHDPLMKVAVGAVHRAARRWGLAIDDQPTGECAAQDGGARLTAALVDQAGATIRPRKQRSSISGTRSVRRMALSNLRSGTPITTSAASRRCTSYHVASGTPVVTILRSARTPKGTEVRTVIKHVTKRLRRHIGPRNAEQGTVEGGFQIWGR
jgi:hypothetical protein